MSTDIRERRVTSEGPKEIKSIKSIETAVTVLEQTAVIVWMTVFYNIRGYV